MTRGECAECGAPRGARVWRSRINPRVWSWRPLGEKTLWELQIVSLLNGGVCTACSHSGMRRANQGQQAGAGAT